MRAFDNLLFIISLFFIITGKDAALYYSNALYYIFRA